MAKKKIKHPKLPNGFGSIKKLSGNRTNPYAVYPPTKEFSPNGSPVSQPALCYVSDWYTGFYALMEYKNGTFDSSKFISSEIKSTDKDYDVISKIIAAYNNHIRGEVAQPTYAQVFHDFYDYKYNRDKTKTYSYSTKRSSLIAFKNTAALHDRIFSKLKTADLQKEVDDCQLKHASKELIVTLYKQMYAYADAHDLCEKNYAEHVRINTPDDDESGVPFSEHEIDILWEHVEDNTIIQGILILIYSGFRISAYKRLEVNFEEQYFKGGVKTKAGIGRYVPFNELIIPFINTETELFKLGPNRYRIIFNEALSNIGITGHTPHDCRHTFSWLCDKYGVDTLSKKLLMGHSLGNDVTDAKYGHRTLDELRFEINKIKHECC